MDRRTVADEYSRRLPPPEAWKQPDRWIDLSTGLVREGIQKIHLDTDERGFLMPTVAVSQLNEILFHEDYDWPFDQYDAETRPDNHHFHWERAAYLPEQHDGSLVPLQFRELPTLIGRMPRQFHNVLHDLTIEPEVPLETDMEEYLKSYRLAKNIYKRLYEAAMKTYVHRRHFTERRRSITEGKIITKDTDDTIGEEYLRTTFSKSFNAYSTLVEEYNRIAELQSSVSLPEIRSRRLRVVQKALAARSIHTASIDLVPVIRGTLAA